MIPAVLLTLSGATALVYQVLWVKQLGLVVGVDVYAVTTVVAAFFAGLAIGGAVFGRRADRAPRPLSLYAGLEVGVAALGLGGTLILASCAPTFAAWRAAAGPAAWLLPFGIVALPALLMGGTLPAMVRACSPRDDTVGRVAGRLYAANTAGAIAGALLTPLGLVPWLGVQGTAWAAATVNLGLAAAAVALRHRWIAPVAAASAAPPWSRGARLAVALYAAAGGLALGYEVVWSQAVVPFVSTRSHAFAVVLATYLTGLAAGAWLCARFADRARRPWTAFGLLLAAAGAAALMAVASLGPWLPALQGRAGAALLEATGNRTAMMCARFAVATAVLILPVTLLLGAAFPLAVRLVAGPERIGRDVGGVVALNTAGGIAGTVLVGFAAIPALGLVPTLGLLATLSAVVGGVAVVRGGGGRPAAWVGAAAVVAAVAVVAVRTPRDKLGRLLAEMRGGELVFHEESPGGTVAVLEQGAGEQRFRRLYIQGVSNSGDSLASRRYMRLQALLPLLVHPGRPRSVLVIGLGTGITSGALLGWPSLERRVCAELLPAVVEAAGHFEGNAGATADPRLEIRLQDGRHALLSSEQRYDVITLEPPPPSAAGVVNLYSRDFYELCRDRLEEGGLLAQWWPLATQNDEDSQSLVRSVLDVFPHVTLWTTEVHETLLIGSAAPLELDFARVAERFAAPEVEAALREVGVDSPTAVLATFVTGRAGLERYAADAPPITDDRPRIEHAAWLRDGEFPRVLRRVIDLRSEPPLVDGAQREAVKRKRDELFAFYRAVYYGYTGEGDRWEALLRRLAPRIGGNAYYRALLGL